MILADDDDDDGDFGSIVTSRSQLQFQRSKKSHLIRIYHTVWFYAEQGIIQIYYKVFFNKHIMQGYVYQAKSLTLYTSTCVMQIFSTASGALGVVPFSDICT